MIFEIYPPFSLNEKGQRQENEDSIYPTSTASTGDRLFIVCDGLGGAEKGEEASRIVSESFATSLKGLDTVFGHDLDRALELAELRLDEYVEAHPDADGMATTLAMLILDKEGAKAAHIGDSRVYHIRKGEILFKTKDHSLVNEMVSSNIITAEEAVNHPKRNIISRAIAGSSRPTKMDVNLITDVRPGDYFFLCSDGVPESVTDTNLVELLMQETTNENKIATIGNLCRQYSKDNFSAYLVQIMKFEQGSNGIAGQTEHDHTNVSGIMPKWVSYTLIILSIITLLAVIFTVVSMR